jgi:hypothetical protein
VLQIGEWRANITTINHHVRAVGRHVRSRSSSAASAGTGTRSGRRRQWARPLEENIAAAGLQLIPADIAGLAA